MNIFYFSRDTKENAQMHCDKHVVKMILELTQMLCTNLILSGKKAPYRATHKNHPSTVWARESLSNTKYVHELVNELHNEYQNRYGKTHKSALVAESLDLPNIEDKGFTDPPKCMPDEYKVDCVVESYRNYFNGEKQHIAQWKNKTPEWFRKV